MRRNDLTSIIPIHFIAVILFGIVTSCNHDTSHGPQLSYGKRLKKAHDNRDPNKQLVEDLGLPPWVYEPNL